MNESASHETASSPRYVRHLLRALHSGRQKDSLVRWASLIWLIGASSVLFLGAQRGLAVSISIIALCGIALRAVEKNRNKVPLMEERRFWDDLRVSFILRIAAEICLVAASYAASPALRIASQALAAMSYLGFFLAVERRPELEGISRPSALEERVVRFAGLLFFLLMFLELDVLSPSPQPLEERACLLQAVLGAYFFFMFAQQSRKASSIRWGALRGLFAVVFLLEAIASALCWCCGPGPLAAISGVLHVTVFFLVILCIRFRHYRFPESNAGLPGTLPIPIGQTMITALLFPLIHLGQNIAYAPIEPMTSRQILLVAALILFAPLALIQHRFLEQRTLELRRERERTERALRRSERKIHMMIQRQKNEETVRRSEEKFTRVFRSAPEVMVISSLPDGKILDINRDAELVLGYHRDELVGERVPDLEIWSDPTDREAMLERLRKDGAIFGLEVEFRTKAGELRLGILSAQTSEIDDAVCLISVLRNITRSERGSRGKEDQLRLLERSRSAVWILDEDGRVSFWNSSAVSIYGREASETRGRTLGEIFPEYRETFEDALVQAREEDSWFETLPLAEPDPTLGPDRPEVFLQWIRLEPGHLVISDPAPDPDPAPINTLQLHGPDEETQH